MANSVPRTTREAIKALQQWGYSQRKIARELGIHRATVSRYLEVESPPPDPSKCTTPSPGSKLRTDESQSTCEPYREFIEEKLALGLDAKRIWRDLVAERGFEHRYASVKRFVCKLCAKDPQRVWRVECAPVKRLRLTTGQ